MSNKPTIPAEVADALEALRSDTFKYTNENILDLLANGLTTDPTVRALCSIPFDILLAALVNGYAREKTEEEKRADVEREIRHTYDANRSGCGIYDSAYEDDAFADGVKYALDMLGVKIEGVNV
ncbi:hypothetical protein [Paenibacillus sp. TC-CSREp1]|uniref:hypothetical protein n=1 Tax=Paenibacillus sp. TC-CSREp1 TaxID=3410089 RepID=UPI003CF2191A